MNWIGQWRNQYRSTVEIRSQDGDRIEGVFATALEDSGFYGKDAAILGVVSGNCISFASVGTSAAGDMVVAYTGLSGTAASKPCGTMRPIRRSPQPILAIQR